MGPLWNHAEKISRI